MRAARVCKVEGCSSRSHVRSGQCAAHWWRLKVHGDVLAHIPVRRMRHGAVMVPRLTAAERRLAKRERAAEEAWAEQVRIAYSATPAEGRGLLWLV